MVFQSWLGQQGGTCLNGICILVKETPGHSLILPGKDTPGDSCLWSRKQALTRSPDTESVNAWNLDFPDSRTEISVICKPPVYSAFVLVTPNGEVNGNPLQCSCQENPRDGGAWWAAIYGVAQSWTRLKRLSSSSSNGLRQNEKQKDYMVLNTC